MFISVDEHRERLTTFADAVALTQQRIEFENTSTKPRSPTEVRRDTLIGKIAEVAVQKHLGSFGVSAEIDFSLYGKGGGDSGDIVVHGWPLDIKSTRPGGRWLMVERSRLLRYQRKRLLPAGYVLCESAWRRDSDTPKWSARLLGYCYLSDIFNQRTREAGRLAQEIPCGGSLPGKSFKLQATNFVINSASLHQDWRGLINRLQNTKVGQISKNNPSTAIY